MPRKITSPDPAEAPETASGPRFLGGAGGRIARALREITGAARMRLTGAPRPDLPAEDLEILRARIDACLAARGGEVAARAQAAEIGRIYLGLSDAGRQRLLVLLAEHYAIDHDAVQLAGAVLARASGAGELAAAEQKLRRLLEAPRMQLLKRFNGIEEGVKFLVDLRADLLRFARAAPQLPPLAGELRELLASWFDAGFLELRAIDWNSPAALLEKLISYEAVHAIRSWDDLKNRLDSDRRCFAFFHPSMPGEPLIFVEVALVNGMSGNIHELLDEHGAASDPDEADTAIFYSISNAQAGLAGVSFGEFLIKRVVNELRLKFPKLKTFATLSPVPGFAAWLKETAADNAATLPMTEILPVTALAANKDAGAALHALLAEPEWPNDTRKARALEPVLMRLCARYLLLAQRADGRARDPVAHFHLSNGARLERINWLGDRSANGMRQSHGVMVNYLYKPGEIEKNFERYSGGHIPAAAGVREKI